MAYSLRRARMLLGNVDRCLYCGAPLNHNSKGFFCSASHAKALRKQLEGCSEWRGFDANKIKLAFNWMAALSGGSILDTFTFGVELEVVFDSPDDYARMRRGAENSNITIDFYGSRSGEVSGYDWKAVNDGSLRGPITKEFVSKVETFESLTNSVRTLTNLLNSNNVRVNRSCGFHVHIGASRFKRSQLANIYRSYGAVEPLIDSFMPRSRRENFNTFCGSIVERAAISSNERLLEIALRTRYTKVNFCALEKHGTIEFRQHSGTSEAKKILNWVDFLRRFVNKTFDNPISPNSISSVEELMDYVGVPAGVKTFYVERAADFDQ